MIYLVKQIDFSKLYKVNEVRNNQYVKRVKEREESLYVRICITDK